MDRVVSTPKRREIDHRTMKLIVGVIALSLAHITNLFSDGSITSISASYYEGGWAQSFFVGFLFAIAAFLLAYNGESVAEMVLSKIAALAALGVALFPCECGGHPPIIPQVHGISAAVMFFVLAYFCYCFYSRARAKPNVQANVLRALVYALCGLVIVVSILVIGYDNSTGGALSARIPRLVFYGERAGLIAFGISWLTASRVLPLITAKNERWLLGDAPRE
jgi:hypothetical protein